MKASNMENAQLLWDNKKTHVALENHPQLKGTT